MGEEKSQGGSQIGVKERQALFDKYVKPNLGLVYQISLQYTKSSNDVEDNYQECLINFFRYIHSYDPSKNILTWIHIVAKRYVIDLEKKRGKDKFNFIEPEKVHNQFVADEEDNIQDITMDNYREKLSDEVLEALDSLNPIYRDTFLKKLMGYKLKEIMDEAYKDGTLKNKNLETIKSRLFLARQHLQKHLKEFYEKR